MSSFSFFVFPFSLPYRIRICLRTEDRLADSDRYSADAANQSIRGDHVLGRTSSEQYETHVSSRWSRYTSETGESSHLQDEDENCEDYSRVGSFSGLPVVTSLPDLPRKSKHVVGGTDCERANRSKQVESNHSNQSFHMSSSTYYPRAQHNEIRSECRSSSPPLKRKEFSIPDSVSRPDDKNSRTDWIHDEV